MKPHGIPEHYIQTGPGEWSAPSRARNAGSLAPRPVNQPNPSHEPVATDARETADKMRRLVRFKIFHIRSQDEENWHTKHFTDALKDAGLIFDDSKEWCRIEKEEIIVDSFADERTEITVELLKETQA